MPFPIYDTADAVPETFRSEYEEREVDGVKKWHAKVPDVTKLNTAIQSERDARKDEEKKRKDAERERDELKRTQQAREKGISDDELKKIRDDEEKARKPILDEVETLKAENRKLKLDDKARALAKAHGIMDDRMDAAMQLIVGAGRLDLSAEGNLVVKDAHGNVTATTAEEFFKTTLRAEMKWLYKANDSSGDGAHGSVTSGGTLTGDAAKALDTAIAEGKAVGEASRKTHETNALAFR